MPEQFVFFTANTAAASNCTFFFNLTVMFEWKWCICFCFFALSPEQKDINYTYLFVYDKSYRCRSIKHCFHTSLVFLMCSPSLKWLKYKDAFVCSLVNQYFLQWSQKLINSRLFKSTMRIGYKMVSKALNIPRSSDKSIKKWKKYETCKCTESRLLPQSGRGGPVSHRLSRWDGRECVLH